MTKKLLFTFEKRFDRNYSAALAKLFVENSTFAECMDEPCDENLNEIAGNVSGTLRTIVTEKLYSLIPIVRPIDRLECINSKRVILVRIYTTYDNGDIVYGLTSWIKTKKGWDTFNPFSKRWISTKHIPYSKFFITYERNGYSFVCKPDFYDDYYFEY